MHAWHACSHARWPGCINHRRPHPRIDLPTIEQCAPQWRCHPATPAARYSTRPRRLATNPERAAAAATRLQCAKPSPCTPCSPLRPHPQQRSRRTPTPHRSPPATAAAPARLPPKTAPTDATSRSACTPPRWVSCRGFRRCFAGTLMRGTTLSVAASMAAATRAPHGHPPAAPRQPGWSRPPAPADTKPCPAHRSLPSPLSLVLFGCGSRPSACMSQHARAAITQTCPGSG